MKTTEKLTEALKQEGAPDDMIDRARNGYYDDFLSPLAMPIMQLVADANMHKLSRIVNRAKDGDFDASREESDEWAASEEGQQTIREFLGGK